MTHKILIVSDDPKAAEAFIATHQSGKLQFSALHPIESISGAVIVSAGQNLPQIQVAVAKLLTNLRMFPVAFVALHQEKALKTDSYAFVETEDYVLPEAFQRQAVGFEDSDGLRKQGTFRDGAFVRFLESNCEDFTTRKATTVSRLPLKAAR